MADNNEQPKVFECPACNAKLQLADQEEQVLVLVTANSVIGTKTGTDVGSDEGGSDGQ